MELSLLVRQCCDGLDDVPPYFDHFAVRDDNATRKSPVRRQTDQSKLLHECSPL